jgi:hypothetical protein
MHLDSGYSVGENREKNPDFPLCMAASYFLRVVIIGICELGDGLQGVLSVGISIGLHGLDGHLSIGFGNG